MKNYLKINFSQFTWIGASIFASKVYLLFFPYFLNGALYNQFNKFYYTASLIILFGSFGFNISASLLKFNKRNVLIGVLLNSVITLIVLTLISQNHATIAFLLSVLIYSVISSFIGIYAFKILFEGNYKKSTIITFIVSFSNILIIPLLLIAHTTIEISLITASLVALILSYKIILKHDLSTNEKGNFKNLYEVGLSAFIINNVIPFALITDKYFANHYFNIPTANAYTFAWSLTAPIFYIGNLIEKMIYSSEAKNTFKAFRNSFSLIFLMIMLYNAFLIIGLNYFPFLLPKSIDIVLLKKVVYFMTAGYSIYVIFHFPINGYLFKYAKILIQEKIAIAFAIFTTIYIAALFLFNRLVIISQYQQLLIAVWVFIFSLLIIKIFLMLKGVENNV
ncbi:MAG: hypothetical protein ACYDA4_14825 [Ignavibacteriaceae bacterium]